jgi:hypothetical protein
MRTVTEKFHATTEATLTPDARERIVDAVMEFHHSRTTAALDTAMTTEGSLGVRVRSTLPLPLTPSRKGRGEQETIITLTPKLDNWKRKHT